VVVTSQNWIIYLVLRSENSEEVRLARWRQLAVSSGGWLSAAAAAAESLVAALAL
jgi:hypothetical protein